MTAFRAAALFGWGDTWLPRFCYLDDLTLDLYHHDGRIEDRWLALDPHEFELLWRLAKAPRRCLSALALLGWAREQADADAALAQLADKLAAHGLDDALARYDGGCVCFGLPPEPRLCA
ncbi:MAG: hypothetical protein MUF47_03640 [Porphyrobacter sp.]|nr:hypothetical protein [Porphyrobacter sp.]